MDLINGIASIISGSGSTSSLESNSIRRITFFTKGKYFLYSGYYQDNIDSIPKPVLGYDMNSFFYVQSTKQNSAHISWGDGTESDYKFSKLNNNQYILGFRSLSCEFYKAPGSNFGGKYLSDGSRWIPEPPRGYGSSGNRKVIMTFSSDIDVAIYSSYCQWSEFPIIESPELRSLNVTNIKVSTIPFNRFSGMKKLNTLTLRDSIVSKMTEFPETLIDCESLTSLEAIQVFNFNSLETSGLREVIKKMTKLTSLNISGCNLPKFIKEINELPNITNLYIGTGGIAQDLSEIDKLNPKIRRIKNFDTWGGGNGSKLSGDPTGWMEWYNGKGMENVNSVGMYAKDSFLDVSFLPQWIFEARSLTEISMSEGFRISNTTDYIDTYIDTIYQETIKHPMSQTDTDGKRNQWYGLLLICWNQQGNYGIRPAGKFQAPSGFVKGKDNGNPTSPLEKVYVLQNNYGQKWTLKPENYD